MDRARFHKSLLMMRMWVAATTYSRWKRQVNSTRCWGADLANSVKVACVQTTSSTSIDENLTTSCELVRAAAADGAALITLPEVVNLCQRRGALAKEAVSLEGDDAGLLAYRALASELDVWILVGSLALKLGDDDRLANRSFLIDPAGQVVARYDKIHMFDVNLADGNTFRESETYRPGTESALAQTPWGPLGLTICYDVRFPYLYRALAQAGAGIITVPSAFTRRTGEAHWHVLMRSRAIETGAFIVAPAQCGDHEDGRKSYGHSLIVDPWGEVVADGGTEIGVVSAELDLEKIIEARSMIPSLTHDREISRPSVAAK
jgi:predicted amidohydrolase